MNDVSPEAIMRQLGGNVETYRPSSEPDIPAKRGRAFGRLTVLGVADLDTASPRDYLLKGIMSPGETSLWVGPPK